MFRRFKEKQKILFVESRDCSRKNLYSRTGGKAAINSSLLFGCGALGSNLAFELARSGCENLGLCDFENLESGNVCRHILDFTSIKKKKADELKDRIKYYNPWGDFKSYHLDVFISKGNDTNELEEFCEYNYWIDAGLPPGPSAYVSSVAHKYKKRLISSFDYRQS